MDPARTEIYTLSLHDALPISESVLIHAAESVIDLAIEGADAEGDGKTYREAAVSLVKSFQDNSRVRVRTGITELDKITGGDRKSTRLNSSHPSISYAVFCLKK